MRTTFTIFLLLLTLNVLGQSTWIESKVNCDKAKGAMVHDARAKFDPLLDELTRDGKFINWQCWEETKGDKLTLVYQFTTDSEEKFREGHQSFIKTASARYPELYKTYSASCVKAKDSVLSRTVMFPLIKNSGAVVVQVLNVDESPDPKMDYNVVIDLTAYPESSVHEDRLDSAEVNWGLQDIGRILNLHSVAGVPAKNLHFVAAVHGWAVRSFMDNESFNKKYKRDNPNLPLIKELSDAGVKFLLCGQSVTWMKIDRDHLTPEAKVTLTAQTTLTSYQMKGYALIKMSND